jgi:hypothetical protein
VATIRRWLYSVGRLAYRQAERLLMIADAGGATVPDCIRASWSYTAWPWRSLCPSPSAACRRHRGLLLRDPQEECVSRATHLRRGPGPLAVDRDAGQAHTIIHLDLTRNGLCPSGTCEPFAKKSTVSTWNVSAPVIQSLNVGPAWALTFTE